MSDISAEIETLEHRFMRAWMRADRGEMRKLMLRDFMMIVGAERPQLLDRPSFLDASDRNFACTGYRLREVVARRHGKCAWFTAGIDLEMKLGGREWKGQFWLTDLWRKAAFKRTWKLAERSLSRCEPDEEYSHAIHRLQLWT
ncbi:nuclear transport factor 2 family protein [uncultured Erythrobacter sp.]|uniref:nuclear transport factor 2 family protein n=1 Tax=uncultured Erythrobacter sp. TaxID=263913 RepID=UPI002613A014|nr:nuclear transport factor 2 family protein [uncultured Erythrobacter sp.]